MIKATANAEQIITRAQKLGLIAGLNCKPGSSHRVFTTGGDSRACTAKPFVIDGKRFSWPQAKQYLAAREKLN